MKVKSILIFVILISLPSILYGCTNSNLENTSSKENNAVQNEVNSGTNKSSEDDKVNSETNKLNEDSKPISETNKSTDNNKLNSKTNKSTDDSELIFKSKLGFSIEFPSNWKNKYTIEENDNALAVYFKSKDMNTPPKSGLLFVIMKKNNSVDENMYDSIDGKKNITINNKNYLIGGPTDVALDPENSDFKLFLSMNKQRKNVIDTIKSLN